MQREAIEFIAKEIQKEDNEKQRAFLRLKKSANKLEANVFGKFIKANKDYKNDDPEDMAYVVYYDAINLNDDIKVEDERTKKVIEQVEYYKYLGFKNLLWIKDEVEDFIILKDDVYEYLFENDPIYPSYDKNKNVVSVQILKEEYNKIMHNARKKEHRKYNKISYTYLKVMKNMD